MQPCMFSPRVEPKSTPSPKTFNKDPEGFAFVVGDLNMMIKEDAISDYFSAYGTVKKVIISPSKEIGTKRKHAFVFMEREESVKKVLDSQPHLICGSAVCVKPDTRKKKAKKLVSQPGSPDSSVEPKPKPAPKTFNKDPEGFAFFVGDLNMTIKEDAISGYFSAYGTVKKVIIFPSKEIKTKRNYAIVFLERKESVKKVLDAQPHFICGSAVCVKPDTRKKKEKKLVSQPGSPDSR
ncbi:unnamed protein product [Schistocephalus solidus]|uniref:RRM domain-containing protein n=1 Tax=Schistocephalus solidus TaxID=70667 RepID=A0A183SB58_SCHSO|nr:unnamed protein product [Schistocephalus solidus]